MSDQCIAPSFQPLGIVFQPLPFPQFLSFWVCLAVGWMLPLGYRSPAHASLLSLGEETRVGEHVSRSLESATATPLSSAAFLQRDELLTTGFPVNTPEEWAQVPRIPTPLEPPSRSPLPDFTPLPPLPSLDELFPTPPSSSPSESLPEGTETIIVNRFEVRGSTVFSPEDWAQITAPYTQRPISQAELFQVRTDITRYYNEQGYINSGAFIPPQTLQDGVVIIQVIEGGVEAINVQGTRRLRPAYIRDRLALATTTPLNLNRLVEALQLLKLDPLIESIASELTSSPTPGLSILEVKVTEADSLEGWVVLDNTRSPSIGSFRQGAGVTEGNLFGLGDRLNFEYNNTAGGNTFDLSYTLPLNPRNGTLRLAYGTASNRVIESPFDLINLETESRYYELTYRQPLLQTPSQEFALGITASRQEAETSILEIPFPLSSGADNLGRTRVSALRFFQEWFTRSENQVFGLRSQLSFGLDALGSTINSDPLPDSRFVSWRLQSQWVYAFAPETLLILRGDLQLTPDALLSLEQFRVGGMDSVRGYRQDLLFADGGLFFSAEMRIPILRVPEWEGLVQLTPFFDYGTGWNVSGTKPDPAYLASVGLGLRFQQGDHLTARLEWGVPLVRVNNSGDSLQESGVYFSLQYRF